MTPALPRRPFVAQATIDSPLGPLLLAATARGLGGAWFDGQAHHPGPLDAPNDAGHRFIQFAAEELASYWADAPNARFTVPLDPRGTAFQCAVWQRLRDIPAGHTSTYSALAALLQKPRALRAVGAAVGRNPLSVIIPCHRVLGSDGSLTGYAGGLARKLDLLQREGRWPDGPPPVNEAHRPTRAPAAPITAASEAQAA
ncbi:methylated-DNA--[protein]-cysteine S-methyltransferase [Ideonella sp. DXS29W]|uniref:Methylated-DNA--protein-cysteine methyltransferase n=1 Tax=Ideonella lacteola TaxID=2984193 RepID=A0ABU9BTK5_9BURK